MIWYIQEYDNCVNRTSSEIFSVTLSHPLDWYDLAVNVTNLCMFMMPKRAFVKILQSILQKHLTQWSIVPMVIFSRCLCKVHCRYSGRFILFFFQFLSYWYILFEYTTYARFTAGMVAIPLTIWVIDAMAFPMCARVVRGAPEVFISLYHLGWCIKNWWLMQMLSTDWQTLVHSNHLQRPIILQVIGTSHSWKNK